MRFISNKAKKFWLGWTFDLLLEKNRVTVFWLAEKLTHIFCSNETADVINGKEFDT